MAKNSIPSAIHLLSSPATVTLPLRDYETQSRQFEELYEQNVQLVKEVDELRAELQKERENRG